VAFLENSNDSKSNARGLSGTVLIYKILGAAAYLNKSLDYLHELGLKVL
jgi:dihydroxyacetone kinase